jgi:hypothetical protein
MLTGARSALPIKVAPEAMVEYGYSSIGSKKLLRVNSFYPVRAQLLSMIIM